MSRVVFATAFWIHILYLLQFVRGSLPPQHTRAFLHNSKSSGKGFSLSQQLNPNWKPIRISTTTIYAAPFLKHRIPMPKELQSALNGLESNGLSNRSSYVEKRVNGQTTAVTNGLYTFPVQIGTPPQNLNILFDTGSGDFWVWSWLMPQTITAGRNIYNGANSSSSYYWDTQSFNLAYTQGNSAYGLVWQDTVNIAADTGNFTIQGNPVECAQNVGGTRLPGLTTVDGVLGLNMWVSDSESPVPQQTWLSYVLQWGNLPMPLFTTSLVQNGTGTMDFGFINATKYTGSIAYTPVTTLASWPASGYWLFNWTGFSIGGRPWNFTNPQVLTDTGTNLVLLPMSMARSYYSHVKGAKQQTNGFWAFPCSSTLPTFTFGVGTTKFTISGKYMIFYTFDEGVNCLGAIQNTDEDSFVVIGTPWFECLFVVHDYGGKRLGFANRAGI